MSKWILTGSLAGIIIAATALLVGFLVVPPIVERTIIESVQIVPGTEQYERWVEVPQPLEFKVYLFNVTNEAEIMLGAKPIVQEIGPYVYIQSRKKFNIRFSRDQERVSYFQNQSYQFDAAKSAPFTEDDNIIVLNMHMNSVLQTIENDESADLILMIVNMFIHEIFGDEDQVLNSFFLHTTPRKFLFEGVKFCQHDTPAAELVCSIVRQEESSSIIEAPYPEPGLLFSMFNHKNTTHDGLYEVNTGIRRVRRLLQIERWNQRRTLEQWNTEENGEPSSCQHVNGTDSTTAGPFREVGDDFYIYSSDICRSVHLHYDWRTSYQGIDAFRYSARDDFLNSMPECFCVNEIFKGMMQDNITGSDQCLLSGAIDLTQCVDAPIVGTMPHFLGANATYGGLIDGLEPSDEKHNVFMEVEPNTGTPLRGGSKLQFNMFLRQVDQIQLSQHLTTPVLFPILWVDEGLELNDEMVQLIKDDLVNVLLLIDIVMWSVFGVGMAMFIAFLIWFFIAWKIGKNKQINVNS